MKEKTGLIQRTCIFVLVFLLIGYWIYAHIFEPSPFFSQTDPAMAYFIDSLKIFNGDLYSFYHHPGTPVDLIGTIVLAATYPFIRGSIDSFIIFHLQNPQIFLGIVRALLLLGSITTLIFFSKYALTIHHWTDELFTSTIAVLYFAIYSRAFTQILTWSHNSFSYPLGTLIVLVLFNKLRSNQSLSLKQVFALGVATGILTAIQLYFVTWVIGVMITIVIYSAILGEKWKKILIEMIWLGTSSIIGFIVITLPIYKLYPVLLDWVIKILTHQGHYGGGSPGFASLQVVKTSFNYLLGQSPGLIICSAIILIIFIITYFIQRRTIKENPGIWASGFGLTIQILVTFTLILKHPNILYLQAVAALLPVLIAVMIDIWQTNLQDSSSQRLLKFSLSLIILIGFLFNLYRAGVIRHISNQQVHAANYEIDSFLNERTIKNVINYKSLMVLYTYGVPSECFALRYGSSYSGNGLSTVIDTLCPNKYMLDLWLNRVQLSDNTLIPPEELNWDIIITLESSLLEFPYLKGYGDITYSDVWLPSFGKIVYIIAHKD